MTLEEAHRLSFRNRRLLIHWLECVCFCCTRTFPMRDIEQWAEGETAICPHCSVDAVLPATSEFTDEFIEQMQLRYFGVNVRNDDGSFTRQLP